jgi:hypothetical protein
VGVRGGAGRTPHGARHAWGAWCAPAARLPGGRAPAPLPVCRHRPSSARGAHPPRCPCVGIDRRRREVRTRPAGPLQQASGDRVRELGAELRHHGREGGGQPRGPHPRRRRRERPAIWGRERARRGQRAEERPRGVERHVMRPDAAGRAGIDGAVQGDGAEPGPLPEGRHFFEHQAHATRADGAVAAVPRPAQPHQLGEQVAPQCQHRVADLQLQGLQPHGARFGRQARRHRVHQARQWEPHGVQNGAECPHRLGFHRCRHRRRAVRPGGSGRTAAATYTRHRWQAPRQRGSSALTAEPATSPPFPATRNFWLRPNTSMPLLPDGAAWGERHPAGCTHQFRVGRPAPHPANAGSPARP